MTEMNEIELLSALLYEVRGIRAKVDATSDDVLHFRKEFSEFRNEMYEFKNEMYEFRRETNNNFNKMNRRLRFVEADHDQLNERVDKLEIAASQ